MFNFIIKWSFEQATDPKYQFQYTLSEKTAHLHIIASGPFVQIVHLQCAPPKAGHIGPEPSEQTGHLQLFP